jgi:uncharacterized protein
MNTPSPSRLSQLLRALAPELHAGTYVFATLHDATVLAPTEIIASVREPEGVSVIVSDHCATAHRLDGVFPSAWITLTVPSALHDVGLTAAVSAALAAEGISCNMVAGHHHDHLFVPRDRAEDAMQVLHRLTDC